MKLLHLLRRHDIDPMINDQAKFFLPSFGVAFFLEFSPSSPPSFLERQKEEGLVQAFFESHHMGEVLRRDPAANKEEGEECTKRRSSGYENSPNHAEEERAPEFPYVCSIITPQPRTRKSLAFFGGSTFFLGNAKRG